MVFPTTGWNTKLIAFVLALTAVLAWQQFSRAAEEAIAIPQAALDNQKASGPLQTAVLSGGCFWGVQGVFEHVTGVRKVVSGYSGGPKSGASYEAVSTGTTGHAESVQITFDPAIVSYGELLQVFFSIAHDPTTLNRQGPDSGTQYRSAIFYVDDTQKKVAEAYVSQLNTAHAFKRGIVTKIDPLKAFYAAEGYHQDYLVHNPNDTYILFNDKPKIANLKRILPNQYSEKPVLLDASM